MAELNVSNSKKQIAIRHRGRGSQIFIYLGKLLRMFIYQSDWKVLPMSALIAGLVSMVIKRRCFISMEGTLMGSFAIICVCIWNGCFNSIQVICRERDVIKREHRSGMHVSSYIAAHMMYQAILCLAQTIITIYVMTLVGVHLPEEGKITHLFVVEFGISMFLISYASDMMSLWVSTLAHNTTTAMTIMPFVLIFQLVFSGGMLTLPEWTKTLTVFTISNPGLKVIATQADTNNRPYETVANLVGKMEDNEIGGTVTVGQLLDVLQNEDIPAVAKARAREVDMEVDLNQLKNMLENSEAFEQLKQEMIIPDMTVGDVLRGILESEDMADVRNYQLTFADMTLGQLIQIILEDEGSQPALQTLAVNMVTVNDVLNAIDESGLLEEYADMKLGGKFTVGEAIDLVAANAEAQGIRDNEITVQTTVGKVVDFIGREKVESFLMEKAAEASYNPSYEYEVVNVAAYWVRLVIFVFVFSLFAMITLEFIDKDKR